MLLERFLIWSALPLCSEVSALSQSVSVCLSGGHNSVAVAGTIGGNVNVVSTNADDTVDISGEATIMGDTNLGLGEQTDAARRRRSHGHGGRGRC